MNDEKSPPFFPEKGRIFHFPPGRRADFTEGLAVGLLKGPLFFCNPPNNVLFCHSYVFMINARFPRNFVASIYSLNLHIFSANFPGLTIFLFLDVSKKYWTANSKRLLTPQPHFVTFLSWKFGFWILTSNGGTLLGTNFHTKNKD